MVSEPRMIGYSNHVRQTLRKLLQAHTSPLEFREKHVAGYAKSKHIPVINKALILVLLMLREIHLFKVDLFRLPVSPFLHPTLQCP